MQLVFLTLPERYDVWIFLFLQKFSTNILFLLLILYFIFLLDRILIRKDFFSFILFLYIRIS